MKKLFVILLFITSGLFTTTVKGSVSVSNTNTTVLVANNYSQMEKRVNEIRKMDIKSLSASERMNLKNELIAMKQKLSGPNGVYISGTALIIIIILLIILL